VGAVTDLQSRIMPEMVADLQETPWKDQGKAKGWFGR
jgi:hypothetical protein